MIVRQIIVYLSIIFYNSKTILGIMILIIFVGNHILLETCNPYKRRYYHNLEKYINITCIISLSFAVNFLILSFVSNIFLLDYIIRIK
jgi:hypothetical protein